MGSIPYRPDVLRIVPADQAPQAHRIGHEPVTVVLNANSHPIPVQQGYESIILPLIPGFCSHITLFLFDAGHGSDDGNARFRTGGDGHLVRWAGYAENLDTALIQLLCSYGQILGHVLWLDLVSGPYWQLDPVEAQAFHKLSQTLNRHGPPWLCENGIDGFAGHAHLLLSSGLIHPGFSGRRTAPIPVLHPAGT